MSDRSDGPALPDPPARPSGRARDVAPQRNADGTPPGDARSDISYSIVGRTPGQKISRALLLVGLLLMLFVVYQVTQALG
jgi:hypothetical protein